MKPMPRSPHWLRVKIGSHDFNSHGPSESVRADYRAWLSAIANVVTTTVNYVAETDAPVKTDERNEDG